MPTRTTPAIWVDHESEGEHVAVGPFRDADDANLFRRFMFADPTYGSLTVGDQTTGRPMSVGEYQDAFRASLVTHGEDVPAHWGAYA